MSQMRLLVIHKVVLRDLNSKWDSNLQFTYNSMLLFYYFSAGCTAPKWPINYVTDFCYYLLWQKNNLHEIEMKFMTERNSDH